MPKQSNKASNNKDVSSVNKKTKLNEKEYDINIIQNKLTNGLSRRSISNDLKIPETTLRRLIKTHSLKSNAHSSSNTNTNNTIKSIP